jgi:UDPglucose--hexose-1-phosphate uridylyltransferase
MIGGELRKDYVLDRWVIISTGRGKRPHQFKKLEAKHMEVDYFAPGNESMTPPEIGRIGTKKKWQMRWFENKFVAVDPEGQAEIRTDNTFFTFSGNYGHHEVLVETPRLDKQLADLKISEIETLFKAYLSRIEDISKNPNIKYVCVFKNHGRQGGTSILHSHSQIIALNHVPKEVMDEVEASKKYENCPYCDIIRIESEGVRKCFENDDFIAFCPYASRYNYEIWVFPKEHIRTLGDVKNFTALAEIMKLVLKKLKKIEDYNFYLHYAPEGEDLHFHIEVTPRIAIWAGFEICSGDIINSVPPEDAAAFYRGDK